MHEAEFIAALRNCPLHDGARGLNDDCAVLELGSETLILTTDSMAAGTHFREDADPFDIAWKLVATNLSDLAAKGAEPFGLLLNYSLGIGDERFLGGLAAILEEYNVPILGGDTITANGDQTHSLTAIGRATCAPVPHRGGAQVGDAIYVTGTLGRAMMGFEGDAEHLEAFNRPRPQLSQGRALAPYVSAMMDISDGLLLDCWRMARASDTTFALEREAIPVAADDRLDECIRWGDDYELLFTAPASTILPVDATMIGTVEPAGAKPLKLDREEFSSADGIGYQHK